MDTNELIRLKEKVETAEKNIQKAEGQIEYMMSQLKERNYNSIEEAEAGIIEVDKKLKKYNKLYDKSIEKINTIMEGINDQPDTD